MNPSKEEYRGVAKPNGPRTGGSGAHFDDALWFFEESFHIQRDVGVRFSPVVESRNSRLSLCVEMETPGRDVMGKMYALVNVSRGSQLTLVSDKLTCGLCALASKISPWPRIASNRSDKNSL